MKRYLWGVCMVGVAVWALDWAWWSPTTQGTWPWQVRDEALNLSGLLAITLMSWAVVLAARPRLLEGPLGGLDRMYRQHKWAALLAAVAALAHWGIEMSDDILKAWVGRAGRVPHERWTGWLGEVQHLAKDMGEWALYAVLAMVVLALWKRFPYRPWRRLHQLMPVLYLMLALHAVMLAPRDYWTQPVGAWLAACLALGSVASLWALSGAIGRARRHAGVVEAVQLTGEVLNVRVKPQRPMPPHRPGQFAFVTLDAREGAHPFTIASAPSGAGTLDFKIKALGDYTRGLPARVTAGQPVVIEGPYGRFDFARHDPQRRQVWVAGGIGVTPFLAWLDPGAPELKAPVDFHLCVRDAATDPLVAQVRALCEPRPTVTLTVHDAAQGDQLSVEGLPQAESLEVWCCGPRGLGEALRRGLKAQGRAVRFHQEAFEMR